MPTNKIPITAYLDTTEDVKLKAIVKAWGCSSSAAIKRLIREKKLKNNAKELSSPGKGETIAQLPSPYKGETIAQLPSTGKEEINL